MSFQLTKQKNYNQLNNSINFRQQITLNITIYQSASSMDRDIRIFNRPIMQKIFRKNQELHLKRLKNIRSVINSKTMMGGSHPISNKKAQQIEEDKKTEIEKQNTILFNRMMKIMKRDDKNNQGTYSTIGGSSYRPRNSLDYSRINQQNRSLFERLQSQKPTISNKKLQNERRKNLTLLKFMGKYPNKEALKYQSVEQGSRGYLNRSNKSQHRRFSSTKEQYYKSSNYNEQEDPQFLISMREEEFRRISNIKNETTENNKNETRQRYHPNRNLETSANKRKFISQSNNRKNNEKNNTIESDEQILKGQQVVVDLPRKPNEQVKKPNENHNHNNAKNPSITLYQTVQKISGRDMTFKIIRHYSKYQITAEPLSKQFTGQVYTIQLTEIEGNDFFVSHDYNFQNVAKLIQIQNGKLIVKSDKIRLKDLQNGSFEILKQLKSQGKKKTQTKQKGNVSQVQNQQKLEQIQKIQKQKQMQRNSSQKSQSNRQNKPKVQIYEESLEQLVQ